jgi:hypothetical protein
MESNYSFKMAFARTPFDSPFKRLPTNIRVERKCVMEINAGKLNTMTLYDEEWAALRDLIQRTDQAVAALHLEEQHFPRGCGITIEVRPSKLLAVGVTQIYGYIHFLCRKLDMSNVLPHVTYTF